MRSIDPQIFNDEFIGTQSMRIRWLWIGLIVLLADDQGRLIDNPMMIRAAIFPYDAKISPDDINQDLKILTKSHKIFRYRSGNNGDGKELIQIVNWWKYQAGAQWASRSRYPAPPKWVDRVRCHERGSGQAVVKSNWELPGGFMNRIPRRLPNPLPSAQANAQASREDEDEDKGRGRGREKEPTTPLPPPSKSEQAAGGGRVEKDGPASTQKEIPPADNNKNHDAGQYEFKSLNKEAQARAKTFAKIMRAASLRDNQKLISLSILVATRTPIRDARSYALAALASAYEDPKAENKIAVACYRIEHEAIDPDFMEPDKWKGLNKEILEAAGIKDLQRFIATQKINDFTYNQKVAKLRSR